MRAYVGVTDGRWYRFLAARPELTEVNFWRPGGGNAFRALQPGEPFFFKSHYPQNQIVGGGFYSGFVPMRVSEAWELLGPGNGAPSLAELRDQIGRYRKAPIGPEKTRISAACSSATCASFPTPRRHRLASPPTSCRARATTWPIVPWPRTSASCCNGSSLYQWN